MAGLTVIADLGVLQVIGFSGLVVGQELFVMLVLAGMVAVFVIGLPGLAGQGCDKGDCDCLLGWELC